MRSGQWAHADASAPSEAGTSREVHWNARATSDSSNAGRRIALRFVVLIGILSFFADFTYEGSRSIIGPYLATLQATGTVVGIVTGFGELLGCGLRVVSGQWADITGRYWPITILGYVVQMASVPACAPRPRFDRRQRELQTGLTGWPASIGMGGRLPSDYASATMTELILTRHGNVEGIDPARFRGRADLELTARGLTEAARLGNRIAELWSPAAIFCSPLKRCVVTAEKIGAACRLAPQPLDALNDIDYGTWQSKTHNEMKEQEPDLYSAWFSTPESVRFPEGESLQDLAARTADVMRHILKHFEGKTVVIVAHDSVNRVLLSQVMGLPLSAYWQFVQHPCCINEIVLLGPSVRLIRMNDTGHLEDRT